MQKLIQRPAGAVEVKFDSKQLSGQYCLTPFISISIGTDGQVGLCNCDAWMPTKIGNILESTLEELLSSELARRIRGTIIDGTYQYCNEQTCGVLRNNGLNLEHTLPQAVAWQIKDAGRFIIPYEIYLAGDLTCNLSCPSCRTRVIKVDAEEIEKQNKIGEKLRQNLLSRPTKEPITLTLSTSGELFASPMLLRFLSGIAKHDFPNLKLNIQTNGLLCEKNWHRLNELQDSVVKITVTIDACQPDTYEKLRRGGKWDDIVAAMQWLKNKRQENHMRLHTRMVVQKDNYMEIEDFYNFSKQFNATRVEYSRISDWGTYKNFQDIDVLNPQHADYPKAKAMLDRVLEKRDAVSWG